MNIKEYKTAFGDSLVELDAQVSELINDRFQPFGKLYHVGPTSGNVDSPICQAMIKES